MTAACITLYFLCNKINKNRLLRHNSAKIIRSLMNVVPRDWHILAQSQANTTVDVLKLTTSQCVQCTCKWVDLFIRRRVTESFRLPRKGPLSATTPTNRPTDWLILASSGTSCSRACGGSSRYFRVGSFQPCSGATEGDIFKETSRVSSCASGDKTRYYLRQIMIFSDVLLTPDQVLCSCLRRP